MSKSKLFVFLVFSLFICSLAMAAEKVNLRQAKDVLGKIQEIKRSLDVPHHIALEKAIGLHQDVTLKLFRKHKDEINLTHSRYNILYKGIPVWGEYIIITEDKDNNVMRMHGNAVTGIEQDIEDVTPTVNAKELVKWLKEYHRAKFDVKDANLWEYPYEKSQLVIYIDGEKAKLCYMVSFFADVKNGGSPTSPVFIVDANTKDILFQYENLMTENGTGPGGNLKTGKYIYGTDLAPFTVTYSNGTSTMDTPEIKTVNLNHGTSGDTAYSYSGTENTFKEINGAYSPINDAHAFGMAVFNMYKEWYNLPPMPGKLVLKVHYSSNYENAFYSSWGGYMAFGDGQTRFYPLVSIDVVSHEAGHGFTSEHSNLTYSGESGGINEAFSDMASEAAEYYLKNAADYEIGAEIFKEDKKALRYMYNPPLDGKSIGHVKDYSSGMDVHYSSGIYNKVYWKLGTTSGWNAKKAFDVFVKANTSYWTSSTTFQTGSTGAIDAAKDYGYNTDDVKNAFLEVGITVSD